MKIFVAGATGVIGKPLVEQLVAAGHEVTGLTRSESKAGLITGLGATPAICDALDSDAVMKAVIDAAPEVVINQVTALPKDYNPKDPHFYDQTNRLRSEGGHNLIEAARSAGVRRFIYWLPVYASALGAKPPRHVPLWLAKLVEPATGGRIRRAIRCCGGTAVPGARKRPG